MIRIAVVDDESIIRQQIIKFIQKARWDAVADAYPSGEALFAARQRYDMVFLDIQMEGISGVEAAKRLRRENEEVTLVFVTGVKEHVFDAFDVGALHYLLKPIEEEKFFEVLERAAAQIESRRQREEAPVFIKTKAKNIILPRNDLLYLESRGKKVEIHTVSEIIAIYAALGELEEQLGTGFYRCHRGYLVNLAHIARYTGDAIRLSNGEEIFLAKDRYAGFVKAYMRCLREGGVCCV